MSSFYTINEKTSKILNSVVLFGLLEKFSNALLQTICGTLFYIEDAFFKDCNKFQRETKLLGKQSTLWDSNKLSLSG